MGLAAWIKGFSVNRRPLAGSELTQPESATSVALESAAESQVDAAQLGVELLRAGKLYEAASAFRRAVTAAPSAANYVNLAYALQELGSGTEALSHLRQAVILDPDSFDARYMLAGALARAGEHDGAATQLRCVISLRPEFEPARVELCRELVAADLSAEARAVIDEAIALNPHNVDFHYYRGNVCLSDSDAAGAIESYRQALAVKPDYAQVHANLGIALRAQKEYDAAISSFERALAIDPTLVDFHVQLALTHKAGGRLDEAVQTLQRVADARPDEPELINQLGVLLAQQGDLQGAERCYRRAIQLRPDQPGAYGNLGLVLYEQNRIGEAIEEYRRGLAIRPLPTTHDNLGIALQKAGAVDEAVEQYRLALTLDPDNLNTRCNLGAALADGGGPRLAIEAYREILKVKPDHWVAHSNLLFNMTYDGESSIDDYLAEARRFDSKLSSETIAPRTFAVAKGSPRPLRVGFVSGDLRSHPVGFFFEGIAAHFDRSRFQLFAYSTSPTEDDLTARLKPLFAQWRFIKGQVDSDVAGLIREDGIDVLVDLAGHSGLNGLPVFAWRPAPVQVTWLGYFASTGVAAMDYVLADALCVPPGSEAQFSEKVWRLPDTRLCYTPPSDNAARDVASLPALERGHITFGSFQRLPKLNDEVLELWGRVAAAVPQARLLLQNPQMARQRLVDELLRRLENVGISQDRVTIRPPANREQYLAAYSAVDIVLDTFPYTGGTTTCEALWMGVPTLTLSGQTMLARQGVAMLSCAGLADWVALTPADYVAKAASFAADVPRLAKLRAGLREQVRSTPLFDTQLFARRLEAALVGMWEDKFGALADLGGPRGEDRKLSAERSLPTAAS